MRPSQNPLLARLEGYMQEAMNRTRDAAVARGGKVYDFGIGDPREPTPEFIRAALRAAVPEVSQYPSVGGIVPLRQAIAGYLRRRFALEVDPASEILPCSGAKEALFHLPLAMLDPARPLCWYPDPAYPVYERAILFARGEPRTLALRQANGFLPDLGSVTEGEWRRTSLVFDCYPHNPTGAGATRAHHERLFSLAREHGFLVVCDEPYVDLYAEEPPHTALEIARQVAPENVLVIHSLSKRSGMTGYRSGFVAGDKALIATLREARANFGVAPPSFVQSAAAAAWQDDAHVAERRAVFAGKRALLLDHVRALGLDCSGAGAFYLWVRVPQGETSASYTLRLAAENILAAPGTFFGQEGEGFFRLAMVPTLADCREAIERWPR